ncbi:Putative Apolipoprotein N-acyltransferase [Streptomyces misionensis JCM 4497]
MVRGRRTWSAAAATTSGCCARPRAGGSARSWSPRSGGGRPRRDEARPDRRPPVVDRFRRAHWSPGVREAPYDDDRSPAGLPLAALGRRRARGRPARPRVPGAVAVVVRLRRPRPVAAAGPLGTDRPAGGVRRLVRRLRLPGGRAPLAAAQPARVHLPDRGAAGPALGALGLAGAPVPGRFALPRPVRRRAPGAAVRLADTRAGPLLAGARRPLGPPRRLPVAGGARAAAGLGGRRVAAELPGGGRERGGGRAGLGTRGPRAGGRRGGRHRRRDLRRLGVGTAPADRRRYADRRRTAGRGGRAGQRRAALRPGGAADPAARRAGRRPGGVGRVQRRLRPRRPARPGPADRRAVPRDGRRRTGERGRTPLRPARDLQEFGAGRPGRPDRRPLRQDASGPLRRVRPRPFPARLGHLGGQGGRRGPQARHRTGRDERRARAADRTADLLRDRVPRHEPAAGRRRRGRAARPVLHLHLPAQLGAAAARLAGRAACRRDRPPDGARDPHRRLRRVRAGRAAARPVAGDRGEHHTGVRRAPRARRHTVRPPRRLAGARGAAGAGRAVRRRGGPGAQAASGRS